MENETCSNCANGYMGYGESSINYGLRCGEYDKSVSDSDTCDSWEDSPFNRVKHLESRIEKLREALTFYSDIDKQAVVIDNGDKLTISVKHTGETARTALKEDGDET